MIARSAFFRSGKVSKVSPQLRREVLTDEAP